MPTPSWPTRSHPCASALLTKGRLVATLPPSQNPSLGRKPSPGTWAETAGAMDSARRSIAEVRRLVRGIGLRDWWGMLYLFDWMERSAPVERAADAGNRFAN